jgi:hypothetical protein
MSHNLSGWGVTGWSAQWAALDTADDGFSGGCGYGIVRVVDPGVLYFQPPLVEGLPHWTPTRDGRGRSFTMSWSEDNPPRYRSLVSFYESLASRRSDLSKEDEELQQFDRAVLELVGLVARLHKAGGTVVFMQPESVLVCDRRDGAGQIVLPDVGFFWDEEQGLREPRWLADPSLDLLFEHGARRRNSEGLKSQRTPANSELGKRASAQATSQAEDVRLLARLVAVCLAGPEAVRSWCGQGRAFLGMPGRDKAPDTLAPVWDQVIAPTLLGHVSSCEDLAARLEAARPSAHFLFKPPAPPPLWKKALRQAAPAMAGLIGIFSLLAAAPLLYAWMFPPCNPHALCKKVCASSALYGQLDELETSRQLALSGADFSAVVAYWEKLEAVADLPAACRDELRLECAGLADKAARELVESLRRRPRPRSEERELLTQAVAFVQRMQAEVSGHQSRVDGLLERQVRLRGGSPNRRSLRHGDAPSVP